MAERVRVDNSGQQQNVSPSGGSYLRSGLYLPGSGSSAYGNMINSYDNLYLNNRQQQQQNGYQQDPMYGYNIQANAALRGLERMATWGEGVSDFTGFNKAWSDFKAGLSDGSGFSGEDIESFANAAARFVPNLPFSMVGGLAMVPQKVAEGLPLTNPHHLDYQDMREGKLTGNTITGKQMAADLVDAGVDIASIIPGVGAESLLARGVVKGGAMLGAGKALDIAEAAARNGAVRNARRELRIASRSAADEAESAARQAAIREGEVYGKTASDVDDSFRRTRGFREGAQRVRDDFDSTRLGKFISKGDDIEKAMHEKMGVGGGYVTAGLQETWQEGVQTGAEIVRDEGDIDFTDPDTWARIAEGAGLGFAGGVGFHALGRGVQYGNKLLGKRIKGGNPNTYNERNEESSNIDRMYGSYSGGYDRGAYRNQSAGDEIQEFSSDFSGQNGAQTTNDIANVQNGLNPSLNNSVSGMTIKTVTGRNVVGSECEISANVLITMASDARHASDVVNVIFGSEESMDDVSKSNFIEFMEGVRRNDRSRVADAVNRQIDHASANGSHIRIGASKPPYTNKGVGGLVIKRVIDGYDNRFYVSPAFAQKNGSDFDGDAMTAMFTSKMPSTEFGFGLVDKFNEDDSTSIEWQAFNGIDAKKIVDMLKSERMVNADGVTLSSRQRFIDKIIDAVFDAGLGSYLSSLGFNEDEIASVKNELSIALLPRLRGTSSSSMSRTERCLARLIDNDQKNFDLNFSRLIEAVSSDVRRVISDGDVSTLSERSTITEDEIDRMCRFATSEFVNNLIRVSMDASSAITAPITNMVNVIESASADVDAGIDLVSVSPDESGVPGTLVESPNGNVTTSSESRAERQEPGSMNPGDQSHTLRESMPGVSGAQHQDAHVKANQRVYTVDDQEMNIVLRELGMVAVGEHQSSMLQTEMNNQQWEIIKYVLSNYDIPGVYIDRNGRLVIEENASTNPDDYEPLIKALKVYRDTVNKAISDIESNSGYDDFSKTYIQLFKQSTVSFDGSEDGSMGLFALLSDVRPGRSTSEMLGAGFVSIINGENGVTFPNGVTMDISNTSFDEFIMLCINNRGIPEAVYSVGGGKSYGLTIIKQAMANHQMKIARTHDMIHNGIRTITETFNDNTEEGLGSISDEQRDKIRIQKVKDRLAVIASIVGPDVMYNLGYGRIDTFYESPQYQYLIREWNNRDDAGKMSLLEEVCVSYSFQYAFFEEGQCAYNIKNESDEATVAKWFRGMYISLANHQNSSYMNIGMCNMYSKMKGTFIALVAQKSDDVSIDDFRDLNDREIIQKFEEMGLSVEDMKEISGKMYVTMEQFNSVDVSLSEKEDAWGVYAMSDEFSQADTASMLVSVLCGPNGDMSSFDARKRVKDATRAANDSYAAHLGSVAKDFDNLMRNVSDGTISEEEAVKFLGQLASDQYTTIDEQILIAGIIDGTEIGKTDLSKSSGEVAQMCRAASEYIAYSREQTDLSRQYTNQVFRSYPESSAQHAAKQFARVLLNGDVVKIGAVTYDSRVLVYGEDAVVKAELDGKPLPEPSASEKLEFLANHPEIAQHVYPRTAQFGITSSGYAVTTVRSDNVSIIDHVNRLKYSERGQISSVDETGRTTLSQKKKTGHESPDYFDSLTPIEQRVYKAVESAVVMSTSFDVLVHLDVNKKGLVPGTKEWNDKIEESKHRICQLVFKRIMGRMTLDDSEDTSAKNKKLAREETCKKIYATMRAELRTLQIIGSTDNKFIEAVRSFKNNYDAVSDTFQDATLISFITGRELDPTARERIIRDVKFDLEVDQLGDYFRTAITAELCQGIDVDSFIDDILNRYKRNSDLQDLFGNISSDELGDILRSTVNDQLGSIFGAEDDVLDLFFDDNWTYDKRRSITSALDVYSGDRYLGIRDMDANEVIKFKNDFNDLCDRYEKAETDTDRTEIQGAMYELCDRFCRGVGLSRIKRLAVSTSRELSTSGVDMFDTAYTKIADDALSTINNYSQYSDGDQFESDVMSCRKDLFSSDEYTADMMDPVLVGNAAASIDKASKRDAGTSITVAGTGQERLAPMLLLANMECDFVPAPKKIGDVKLDPKQRFVTFEIDDSALDQDIVSVIGRSNISPSGKPGRSSVTISADKFGRLQTINFHVDDVEIVIMNDMNDVSSCTCNGMCKRHGRGFPMFLHSAITQAQEDRLMKLTKVIRYLERTMKGQLPYSQTISGKRFIVQSGQSLEDTIASMSKERANRIREYSNVILTMADENEEFMSMFNDIDAKIGVNQWAGHIASFFTPCVRVFVRNDDGALRSFSVSTSELESGEIIDPATGDVFDGEIAAYEVQSITFDEMSEMISEYMFNELETNGPKDGENFQDWQDARAREFLTVGFKEYGDSTARMDELTDQIPMLPRKKPAFNPSSRNFYTAQQVASGMTISEITSRSRTIMRDDSSVVEYDPKIEDKIDHAKRTEPKIAGFLRRRGLEDVVISRIVTFGYTEGDELYRAGSYNKITSMGHKNMSGTSVLIEGHPDQTYQHGDMIRGEIVKAARTRTSVIIMAENFNAIVDGLDPEIRDLANHLRNTIIGEDRVKYFSIDFSTADDYLRNGRAGGRRSRFATVTGNEFLSTRQESVFGSSIPVGDSAFMLIYDSIKDSYQLSYDDYGRVDVGVPGLNISLVTSTDDIPAFTLVALAYTGDGSHIDNDDYANNDLSIEWYENNDSSDDRWDFSLFRETMPDVSDSVIRQRTIDYLAKTDDDQRINNGDVMAIICLHDSLTGITRYVPVPFTDIQGVDIDVSDISIDGQEIVYRYQKQVDMKNKGEFVEYVLKFYEDGIKGLAAQIWFGSADTATTKSKNAIPGMTLREPRNRAVMVNNDPAPKRKPGDGWNRALKRKAMQTLRQDIGINVFANVNQSNVGEYITGRISPEDSEKIVLALQSTVSSHDNLEIWKKIANGDLQINWVKIARENGFNLSGEDAAKYGSLALDIIRRFITIDTTPAQLFISMTDPSSGRVTYDFADRDEYDYVMRGVNVDSIFAFCHLIDRRIPPHSGITVDEAVENGYLFTGDGRQRKIFRDENGNVIEDAWLHQLDYNNNVSSPIDQDHVSAGAKMHDRNIVDRMAMTEGRSGDRQTVIRASYARHRNKELYSGAVPSVSLEDDLDKIDDGSLDYQELGSDMRRTIESERRNVAKIRGYDRFTYSRDFQRAQAQAAILDDFYNSPSVRYIDASRNEVDKSIVDAEYKRLRDILGANGKVSQKDLQELIMFEAGYGPNNGEVVIPIQVLKDTITRIQGNINSNGSVFSEIGSRNNGRTSLGCMRANIFEVIVMNSDNIDNSLIASNRETMSSDETIETFRMAIADSKIGMGAQKSMIDMIAWAYLKTTGNIAGCFVDLAYDFSYTHTTRLYAIIAKMNGDIPIDFDAIAEETNKRAAIIRRDAEITAKRQSVRRSNSDRLSPQDYEEKRISDENKTARKIIDGVIKYKQALSLTSVTIGLANALDSTKGQIGIEFNHRISKWGFGTSSHLYATRLQYSNENLTSFCNNKAVQWAIYALVLARRVAGDAGVNKLIEDYRMSMAENHDFNFKQWCKDFTAVNGNPIQKFAGWIYDVTMKMGTAAWVGKKIMARNFVREFADRAGLDDLMVTMYGPDSNMKFNDMLAKPNPEEFLLTLFSDPKSRKIAEAAYNKVLTGNVDQTTLMTRWMSYVSERHPGTKLGAVFVSGTPFLKATWLLNRRVLNYVAPVSSMGYMLVEKIASKAGGERDAQGNVVFDYENSSPAWKALGKFLEKSTGMNLEEFVEMVSNDKGTLQIYTDFRQALLTDLQRMTLPMFGIMLALIPGALEPPEDDDKYDDYEEWTLFGIRVNCSWYVEDIIGPIIPYACWYKSMMNGKPSGQLMWNGIYQLASTAPLVRMDTIFDLFTSPEDVIELKDDETDMYESSREGEPDTATWIAGKSQAIALSFLGQWITPKIVTDIARSNMDYQVAYNKEYVEDASGERIVNDDGTYRTQTVAYDKAQIRRLTAKNPILGWVVDCIARSFGGDDTGYKAIDMPNTVITDDGQMEFMHTMSVYDYENDTMKPDDEVEAVCAALLFILDSNDDMDALYDEGFYLDRQTRDALTDYIWALYTDEVNSYNAAVADGALNWRTWSSDYSTGMSYVNEFKNQHNAILSYYKNELYYGKLTSPELNQGLIQYNRINTTWKQDANGDWYATGMRSGDSILGLAPFTFAQSIGTAGRDGDWATISEVTGNPMTDMNGNAMRGLVPVQTDMGYISWDDYESGKAGTNTTGSGTGTGGQSYSTYGGGVYSRRSGGGGGGGYAKKVSMSKSYPSGGSSRAYGSNSRQRTGLLRLNTQKENLAPTLDGKRILDPQFDYLRPNYETKGSRKAYRRSDF